MDNAAGTSGDQFKTEVFGVDHPGTCDKCGEPLQWLKGVDSDRWVPVSADRKIVLVEEDGRLVSKRGFVAHYQVCEGRQRRGSE